MSICHIHLQATLRRGAAYINTYRVKRDGSICYGVVHASRTDADLALSGPGSPLIAPAYRLVVRRKK